MSQSACQYARDHGPAFLEQLQAFLLLPSISTLPEHTPDVLAAAQWLVRDCEAIGLEHVQLLETAGHPVVYADWLHAQGKPTVLVYGHYDVQPVDPVAQWDTPPFEPTLKGEDLFARGASDDKGQVFAHLKAAEALLKAEGSLPVNLKFIIEGEEEIGSAHLEPTLIDNAALLQADVCLISDSNILAPDRPALSYGLRGLVYAEIAVQGPSHDLHSGRYGGGVHNPLQALCEIVAQLHDAHGRVTVPGFYDDVRTPSVEEKDELAALGHRDEDFLAETGAPATWGEAGFSTLERLGTRPTLELHGIRGGFTGEGAKTVIPASCTAKVSMRLVPHQSCQEVGQRFKAYVLSIAPPTVKVTVHLMQSGDPVLIDREHGAVRAAATAYEQSFGAKPLFTLDGGSIPVVEQLQKAFDLPVVLMGLGLPDDQLHAPNEKFHLPNFYNGIDCSIRFLQLMADQ